MGWKERFADFKINAKTIVTPLFIIAVWILIGAIIIIARVEVWFDFFIHLEPIDIIAIEIVIATIMISRLCMELCPNDLHIRIPKGNASKLSDNTYKDLCHRCNTYERAIMSWTFIHYALVVFPILFSFATIYTISNTNEPTRSIIYAFLSLAGEIISIIIKADKRAEHFQKRFYDTHPALLRHGINEISDTELIGVFDTKMCDSFLFDSII